MIRNLREVKRIASSLFGLNDYVTRELTRLYYELFLYGKTQGKHRVTLIAALIYYVRRREGRVIPMKRISEQLKLNEKRLWHRYKSLKRELNLSQPDYDYSNLIYEWNNELDYNYSNLRKVRKKYEEMKDSSRDPRVLVANAFYQVSLEENLNKTLEEISRVTGVSESAIRC